MRILHTADWHIGQSLNGWARDEEHRIWLGDLGDVIANEEIDVLLIAGDVFDGNNPSGESQQLFYRALRDFRARRPNLRTIITSGNHDPARRLEAPAAILEELDVHVFASLRRTPEGDVDYQAHLVPLLGESGAPEAWVCAIPFLRAPDLPGLSFASGEGRGSPIVEAAGRLHTYMAEAALAASGELPVIAMGHLHCVGASESEGSEKRIIIGGEHALPADTFPEAFDYVALGHLHMPQNIGRGRGGAIRYCGSCFPLSAAEYRYTHGVTVIDLEGMELTPRHHPIPSPAAMLRFPAVGTMTFEALEEALEDMDEYEDLPVDLRPFVYINLEATGPAAVIMGEAERLIATKPVRLAGIKVRRLQSEAEAAAPVMALREVQPEDLFKLAFEKVNSVPPSAAHIAAFREEATGAE